MAGIYSDESDRAHINPYNNQPPAGDAVMFNPQGQWKSFTVDKQGHMTSLQNSHGLITSASMSSPSIHNHHALMTSSSLVSQNNHTISSPAMVTETNHSLMASSQNEMLVNGEQKSVHPYTAYYPPWPGHVPIHPGVGHSSFGQMLGGIEPSRVSVPISTHLNRQDIIPVLANSVNSMPTVNMVGHLNPGDSVTIVAHANRQDGVGDLPIVSHMSNSMHKEYWPSVVSTMHPPNISNGCVVPIGNGSNNCVMPAGHVSNNCDVPIRHITNHCVPTVHISNCVVPDGQSSNSCVVPSGHSSNSVLASITSCSNVMAGSVMSQIINQKVATQNNSSVMSQIVNQKVATQNNSSVQITSSVYQPTLSDSVVAANCGKTMNAEQSYAAPVVSSLCQVSQHCYPKPITSITEQVVEAAQEDIVARAMSQSLNPECESLSKLSNVLHCGQDVRDAYSSMQKSQSFSNTEKPAGHNVTQSFLPVDKTFFDSSVTDSSVNNLPPYETGVRKPFLTGDKPVRRGPGRPPGSASSGDDPQEKPYQCEYCERRFKHSQQRRVHVMSHTGERPHSCPYCQKGFKTLAQKTDHIRVHTGDKPYKCTICWREFGKYATMKKHLNTHLDTPPYQCTHCQKGFYLADRLKVHIREHTDERPFQCDQCERAFRNANHLKFHKMVHTGEVPFRCEICWKGFQDSVKFDRHQICHQNDNLLRCANCQVGFARVEEMTEHFEVCRANENNTKPSGWVSF